MNTTFLNQNISYKKSPVYARITGSIARIFGKIVSYSVLPIFVALGIEQLIIMIGSTGSLISVQMVLIAFALALGGAFLLSKSFDQLQETLDWEHFNTAYTFFVSMLVYVVSLSVITLSWAI